MRGGGPLFRRVGPPRRAAAGGGDGPRCRQHARAVARGVLLQPPRRQERHLAHRGLRHRRFLDEDRRRAQGSRDRRVCGQEDGTPHGRLPQVHDRCRKEGSGRRRAAMGRPGDQRPGQAQMRYPDRVCHGRHGRLCQLRHGTDGAWLPEDEPVLHPVCDHQHGARDARHGRRLHGPQLLDFHRLRHGQLLHTHGCRAYSPRGCRPYAGRRVRRSCDPIGHWGFHCL
mmetsp:Transcript_23952/g.57093  ORF Transcript_23952/g.57093 Transcript_23952/m.57093 type:complete len:226 (+) Transcript_23952:221-898(+)